jgi:hypothetical protein
MEHAIIEGTSLVIQPGNHTVVSSRLNVVRGLKRTNQIVGF